MGSITELNKGFDEIKQTIEEEENRHKAFINLQSEINDYNSKIHFARTTNDRIEKQIKQWRVERVSLMWRVWRVWRADATSGEAGAGGVQGSVAAGGGGGGAWARPRRGCVRAARIGWAGAGRWGGGVNASRSAERLARSR